jgi:hypothetical protein
MAGANAIHDGKETLLSCEKDSWSVAHTSHLVWPLAVNTLYLWRVLAENALGVSAYSPASGFMTGFTDVQEGYEIPREFSLRQNDPHPFNPSTTIR